MKAGKQAPELGACGQLPKKSSQVTLCVRGEGLRPA
jgi:hypothetical protein